MTREQIEKENFNFYKDFAPWLSDECAWNWAKNPLRNKDGICVPDDMGLLYIATDTSRYNEYKIGRTSCNDPFTRELKTTSPNYKVLYMAVSRSIVKDEAKIHKWCKDFLDSHIQYDSAKEWFKLDDDYLQFVIDKFHFVKAERPFKVIRWKNVNPFSEEGMDEPLEITGAKTFKETVEECNDTFLKIREKTEQIREENKKLREENKKLREEVFNEMGWKYMTVKEYFTEHNLSEPNKEDEDEDFILGEIAVTDNQLEALARFFHHEVEKAGDDNAYGPDTWALWGKQI